MRYIDLHVHSVYSDGTMTPAWLVDHAVKLGLGAVALTDHDSIEGVKEALAAGEAWNKKGASIRVIPGVELSVAYKDRDIHLLGLFIDPDNRRLSQALDKMRGRRDARNEEMARKLAAGGILISMEEILKEVPENTAVTRAHFAACLVKKGYVKSNKEAFEKYLGSDGPYFAARKYIPPEEAIELIREAGGIPILAHPLIYKLAGKELEALIVRLKGAGLMGLEALYSANTAADEAYALTLAHRYGLMISGGSDFHGTNKPDLELGRGRGNLKVPETVLAALEKSLSK
ncbi:PHP domain-containing protein [Anaerolentibacter hominis]|uniref:PHP domain-containing protein n=1 Tax=Anaerolentibacter hominis TaxID=3079009 RepID=UPI0031B86197